MPPWCSTGSMPSWKTGRQPRWFTTDKNGVYRYDGLRTPYGWRNNSAFSILEDSAGTMWLATLGRYDGERFTTFRAA